MGNTVQGAVTKLLTLVPVLVAIYYFDLPKFAGIFSSPVALTYLLVAASFVVFGVALKRRILRVRLELSKISFSSGMLLFGAAVLLYIYGSYLPPPYGLWYHFESLYVLIVGYVAIRIGMGILRALGPLIVIMALAFPFAAILFNQGGSLFFFFLSTDAFFFLLFAFIGFKVRPMLVPLVVLLIGYVGWYFSASPLLSREVILSLVSLPLLFLISPKIRRFVSIAPAPVRTHSDHHLLPDGFCSICGQKISRATNTGENFGLWGLVAVVGVAALILFASVPILAIINNVPYDAHYSSLGYSGTVTPLTPPGWQVNSTTLYTNETNSYAVARVYVPTYHPETKNYTVYYELNLGSSPVANGPSGGEIPGLDRISNVFQLLGPFQGYLTTYTAPGSVLLVYQGRTSMLFLSGSTFEQYAVGVGFARDFKDANVSQDQTQFLGDVSALWLPAFDTDVAYSGLTNTLYFLDAGLIEVGPVLLLAASVMAIGWGAYRTSLSDERLDRFLTLASAQPEEYWSYLSRLVDRRHRAGTGEEIGLAAPGTQAPDAERADSSLRELERRHLVKRSLVERGGDLVSVWRPAI